MHRQEIWSGQGVDSGKSMSSLVSALSESQSSEWKRSIRLRLSLNRPSPDVCLASSGKGPECEWRRNEKDGIAVLTAF
jgi:hypothetical protein